MDDNGLLYLRARYYHPGLGVFTALDPVENLNRYQYVDGNPTNRIDPSGLVPQPPQEGPCPPGYEQVFNYSNNPGGWCRSAHGSIVDAQEAWHSYRSGSGAGVHVYEQAIYNQTGQEIQRPSCILDDVWDFAWDKSFGWLEKKIETIGGLCPSALQNVLDISDIASWGFLLGAEIAATLPIGISFGSGAILMFNRDGNECEILSYDELGIAGGSDPIQDTAAVVFSQAPLSRFSGGGFDLSFDLNIVSGAVSVSNDCYLTWAIGLSWPELELSFTGSGTTSNSNTLTTCAEILDFLLGITEGIMHTQDFLNGNLSVGNFIQ